MKLTIATNLLQSLVARASKGASNDKMIPLTGLMSIELKDHKLTLTTTDASNYLYVVEDKVAGEDFSVVVQVDMFSKLVARMTCEFITLTLTDSCLLVQGNGKYSIDLPLDENGEPIVYPNPLKDASLDGECAEINLSTIRLISSTAKSSLANTLDIPCYTGYYMGSSVVATDTYKICSIDIDMFDYPVLLSSSTIDMFDTFTDEKISVYRDESVMVFKTPTCIIYSKIMDCIDEYAIDDINGLVHQDFSSSCKIAKSVLLQLLDRLSLFVGVYDKNGIYLTFTREGLQIESKKSNSVEVISYMASSNFTDFTCCIDIEMFRTQVKANTGDSITIQYGEDNAIKLTDGNVTQVVALLEDDR